MFHRMGKSLPSSKPYRIADWKQLFDFLLNVEAGSGPVSLEEWAEELALYLQNGIDMERDYYLGQLRAVSSLFPDQKP